MEKSYITEQLFSLRKNLMIGENEDEMQKLILALNKGDTEELMRIYVKNRLPVRVSHAEWSPSISVDYSKSFIDFSLGFENFVEIITEEARLTVERYRTASIILTTIFKLPMPYSMILYLRHYQELSVDEIIQKLHYSRSNFYYKYKIACRLLEETLEREYLDKELSRDDLFM